VVIEDGAQDGLDRAVVRADRRAVHEVAEPQIIDIVYLEGFAHIGAFFGGKPPLGFDDSEQGVVVDGGLTEETLVSQLFIEFLG
jgi:hypothetical protein